MLLLKSLVVACRQQNGTFTPSTMLFYSVGGAAGSDAAAAAVRWFFAISFFAQSRMLKFLTASDSTIPRSYCAATSR